MNGKNTYSLLLVIISFNVFAQVPNFQWARSAMGSSGISDFYGWAVAADGNGNVYIAGRCNSDTIIFGNDTLVNSGGESVCLVKYDANGNVLWAKQSGNGVAVEARGITTDASGNVYVTGHFEAPSITFGSLTLFNAGSGTYDMFLVKYDSSGSSVWGRRAGGPDNDWGNAVTVDASGNVFVTGGFTSISITFGTFTLVNSDQILVYNETYFVKYNSNGAVIWAKSSGGINGDEWGTALTTDAYGNSFICGPSYSATIYFGIDSLVNPNGLNHTQQFIASYTPSGNIRWLKQITFPPIAGGYLYSIATDAFGNVIVTGSCESDTAYIGPFILPTVNGSFYDMLIAKYDSSGNVVWAKRPSGGLNLEPMSLTVDASGNSYIAGFFDCDSIVFDSSNILHVNYYAQSDLFLVKYSASGNVLWTKGVDGIYLPGSYGYSQVGISCDPMGSVFVAGSIITVDTVIFDMDTAYTNNCYPNMFLAKLNNVGFCSANFTLYPDTSTLHNYWAVNSASGSPPLHYDWDWGDGSPHDTIAYPNHTYATAGYYTICLIIADAASCTNTICHTNLLQVAPNSSAPMTMVQVNAVPFIPTSTIEIPLLPELLLFPNPALSEITIESSELGIESLEIYNILGKRIYEIHPASKTHLIIDTSDFPSGIYFARLREVRQEYVAKFVKQ